MADFIKKLAEYRKGAVAWAAFAGIALSQGLVTGTAAHWLAAVIAALGAVGVVQVPNEPYTQKVE